jgi:hypothetical protein
MRFAITMICVGAVVIAAPLARAQPSDRRTTHGGYIGKVIPTLEIDNCPPIPDKSPDELRKQGAEHYQRGEQLYAQGDYEQAVTELVASYCLFPSYYKILKDIGQAYERDLDYERAIAYLERYVTAIPRDAKRDNECSPDPQDDRKLVSFRIEAMRKLRARILVDTTPGGARITLSNDTGIAGRTVSGQPLMVIGGAYTMTIERDGFKPKSHEILAEIGKPYTYVERLEPLTGRLRVRAIPANARLFLDRRAVSTGTYDADLPGGRYTITAEAEDHLAYSQEVEVLPERDTPVTIELAPTPQFGRRQLIAYSALAGGAAGGAMLSTVDAKNQLTLSGLGFLGGAIAGLAGSYWGLPNVPLGTSDLTITSSLIGGVAFGGVASLFSDNIGVVAPLAGGGLVLGGVLGYYVGDRIHVRVGEAAVVNSGAVWGTIAGTLLVGSFSPGTRVGAGIVLSGLGMGTTAGVLMSRFFTVSRGHAALIDVSGVVGMIVGVAAENLAFRQTTTGFSSQAQTEHTSNFALGGLAIGLIVGAILTRTMDNAQAGVGPALGVAPTGDGKSATTFGVSGRF